MITKEETNVKTPDGPVELSEFVRVYSDAYFFGHERIKYAKGKIRYQQTWEPAEREIIEDPDIFDYCRFKRLMAWKMGRIAHKKSFEEDKKQYYDGWESNTNPKMYGKTINLKEFHENLLRCKDITASIENGDIEKAINSILKCSVLDSYIGPVYAITILCFMSKGKYPIYDRFVLTSLKAIEDKRYPKFDESRQYHNMNKSAILKEYKDYYIPRIEVLLEKLKIENNNYLKYRRLDRALWVYGHGFLEYH